MTDPDLRAMLAGLPHFAALPEALLARVVAASHALQLDSGELVFREGDPCDGFYVLGEGRVVVFRLTPDGREQIVHQVEPGRTFAEAALFHAGRFPASARAAASPTRILRIDGPTFRGLLRDEPALAESMVGSLCIWLHTLLDRIEVLTLSSAGSRLAHHLLRLPARDGIQGLVVTLPGTKKDLAGQLSITPETLSRLLGRWRERGLVAVDGAHVTLLDASALEAVAEGDAGRD